MTSESRTTYVFSGLATAESPLATCGPELSKRAGKNDPRPIPVLNNGRGAFMYMPGAGLRSKLRGAATALVREALIERKMRLLSLADAQLLRVGGIKQAGKEAALDAAEFAEMVRKNPILGVFGASTPWVAGKAMIGHLICQMPIERGVFEPMVIDGVRADILRREPQMVQFLTPDAMDEYAQTIERVKAFAKIKGEIRDLEQRAAKAPDSATRRALRDEAAKRKKDTKDASVVSAQMPLAGYNAIPPGAVLDSKMRLLNASGIELGCLLAALDRFAQEPLLGAHAAHGAGEISVSWAVSSPGRGDIGRVTVLPFDRVVIDDALPNKPLARALQAFRDFLASGDLEPWSNEALLAGDADESDE